MGTLFSQRERDSRRVSPTDVQAYLENAVHTAKQTGVNVSEYIEAARLLEQERRNSLYVADGDAHDEQMAGLGELLRELIDAVKDLKSEA